MLLGGIQSILVLERNNYQSNTGPPHLPINVHISTEREVVKPVTLVQMINCSFLQEKITTSTRMKWRRQPIKLYSIAHYLPPYSNHTTKQFDGLIMTTTSMQSKIIIVPTAVTWVILIHISVYIMSLYLFNSFISLSSYHMYWCNVNHHLISTFVTLHIIGVN